MLENNGLEVVRAGWRVLIPAAVNLDCVRWHETAAAAPATVVAVMLLETIVSSAWKADVAR